MQSIGIGINFPNLETPPVISSVVSEGGLAAIHVDAEGRAWWKLEIVHFIVRTMIQQVTAFDFSLQFY